VLLTKTVYVAPPSVEIRISTFAQLTGLAVVPATFHVTVCEVAPTHEIPVAVGYVTVNGPDDATLTVTASSSLQPPFSALSRTVTLKFIVLATVGKTSQVKGPFAASAVKLGKYLVGLVVGSKLLKFGPLV
jgi:hypothetical protein